MRRVLSIVVSTVLALAGVAVLSAPAEAASGVTLKDVPTQTVNYGGFYTLKASYRTTGDVKISSSAVSVDGEDIDYRFTSVRSAKLPSGNYQIRQRVSYRVKQRNSHYSAVKNVRGAYDLRIKDAPQNCALRADYDSVHTVFGRQDDDGFGDASVIVSKKLFSSGSRVYETITLGQLRKYLVNEDDDESVAQVDELIERYETGAQTSYIVKKHRLCNTSRVAVVDFAGTEAISQSIADPAGL